MKTVAYSALERSAKRSAAQRLWRALLARRGQALVETAMIMPAFTLIMVGAIDFARFAFAGIEVSNAARAGAMYGAQNHATATNISGMEAVAVADAADITSLSAIGSYSCVCTDGTTITCTNAPTLCLSPARTLLYVTVNTSKTESSIFSYTGIPASLKLTGSATMRVAQ
jgi:Flp pilus assembly protein TadG